MTNSRRLTRRQFLKATVYAGGSLLAGCRPGSLPNGSVQLDHWYHQYGESGTEAAVHRYAREYTRLNPHVSIQVTWVPGDYGSKLAAGLLVPGGPDVFESGLSFPMVDAGQVVPLDDLIGSDVRGDFSPSDLAANIVNGKLYGIKMLDDMGLLYYRKSHLQAAGISPPTDMDSLIDATRKLTSGDRKGLFVGNDGGITSLSTILPWSAGVDLLNGRVLTVDSPRSAQSFAKLRDLNTAGGLLIGAPLDWWDPSSLIQGLCSMQWTGLWAYPRIRKALGDDVGAMPWPALDAGGRPATFLGGWTQMVNGQGQHIEEAKAYVKWLWVDNKDIQRDWCLSYGFHVPARISLANEAAPLKEGIPADAVKALRSYGKFMPPTWNAAMGTALTDALVNIVKNGSPPQEQLAKASRKCSQELRWALEG